MSQTIDAFPEVAGAHIRTKVWMSDRAKVGARRQLANEVLQALQDKLVYCAENGFHGYEGSVVVHEGKGIYRFGIKLSLFRWWGFYNGFQWSEFIILDWTMKRGQKRGKAGNDMVKKLVGIRDKGGWRKAVRT